MPGRPVGLVTGDGVEVDTELADVDAHLRHRLSAVDQDQGAGLVGHARDLGDRVERSEHVRDVGDGDQLRAAGKRRLELAQQQLAVVVDPDPIDLGAGRFGQLLPGDDVGVVLHLGQHDPVARVDVGRAPAARDEVDRLGRVADEDDLAAIGRAEVVGDRGPRTLVGGGRLGRERVRAAVDVGVVAPLVTVDGLDRGEYALRARARVEVDEGLVADPAAQRRERLADALDVERPAPAAGSLDATDAIVRGDGAGQARAATSSLIQP